MSANVELKEKTQSNAAGLKTLSAQLIERACEVSAKKQFNCQHLLK